SSEWNTLAAGFILFASFGKFVTLYSSTPMTYSMAKARYINLLGSTLPYILTFLLLGAPAGWPGTFQELCRIPIRGVNPSGLIRGPGGEMYGVTYSGGTLNKGTLFRLDPNAGFVETLASFGGDAGEFPTPGFAVDQSGNIFGITYSRVLWRWNSTSGLTRVGRLGEITASDASVRVVLDGEGGVIGALPYGSNFIGPGLLWRWHESTGVKRLAECPESITGRPTSDALATDGRGTIYGCSDTQVLWRWSADQGFENLAKLGGEEINGESRMVAVDASGRVFCCTPSGGAWNEGSLWRWDAANGAVKLADFDRTNVPFPRGPLAFDSVGTLFGISHQVIWKWTSQTGLTRYAELPEAAVGDARGSFLVDQAGAIYGT